MYGPLGPRASTKPCWPHLNHVKGSHVGWSYGLSQCVVSSNIAHVDCEVHNAQAQVAKQLVARRSSVVASAL